MKLITSLFFAFCIFISCQHNQSQESTNSEIQQKDTVKQIVSDSIIFSCDFLNQNTPGAKAELFSPNFISTKVEHSAVMFTPDGREMWFGRMSPAKIWYLTFENGVWSEIKKAPLDDNYHYLYPFLSNDGNRLYFTSDRPTNPNKERVHRGDDDLWYIERNNNKWSDPIHLGDTINLGNRHSIGSVSSSGNIYYTVRTGKLYHYITKMYFAEFNNGMYKSPKLISELNSDQPSHSPFVAPDESYLIFSSFRGGIGMSDLFISFKKEDGNWSNPKNLGSDINSIAKDEFPYITPDGKYLFFNSNRISELNSSKIQSGPGNMYWVKTDFIEELRQNVQ
jgi:hypothetical protein